MIRLIRYFRKVYFEIARNFEHTESWWNNYRDLL